MPTLDVPAKNWIFKMPKGFPFTVLKTLRFLSHRCSADFRRSRLVSSELTERSHCMYHFLCIMHFYRTLFWTHPMPLPWNTKPFQSRRVPLSSFFRHCEFPINFIEAPIVISRVNLLQRESKYLTLFPNDIAFYKGGGGGSKKQFFM